MENMVDLFDNTFAGKKVLITGNTGFKGSWLTIWLLELGADVYGFSRGIPTGPSLFKHMGLEEKITHREGDIYSKNQVLKFYQDVKPDIVFHLAAQPIVKLSYQDPTGTFESNFNGTLNILECLRTSTHKVSGVFVTSDKCYFNEERNVPFKESDSLGGKDPYSASKAAAELVIQSYYYSFFKEHDKVQVASGRAGNVIGGGDWADARLVPDCIKSWKDHLSVEVRSPRHTRPWQHVLEPLSGYMRLAENLGKGENLPHYAYNFGPEQSSELTVVDLVRTLGKYWFKNQDEEKWYHLSESVSFDESFSLRLDSSAAKKELKWKPVWDFEETVRMTVEWYDHFYKEPNPKDMLNLTIKQIRDYSALASKSG